MKRRRQCVVIRTLSAGFNFFERGCGGRIEACSDGELIFKGEKTTSQATIWCALLCQYSKEKHNIRTFCTISSIDD